MTIRLLTSCTLIFLVNCSFAQKEINDSVQNQEVSISGYNKEKALSDIKKDILKSFYLAELSLQQNFQMMKLSRKSTEFGLLVKDVLDLLVTTNLPTMKKFSNTWIKNSAKNGEVKSAKMQLVSKKSTEKAYFQSKT